MPGRSSNPRKQIRELLRQAERLQHQDMQEALRYTERACEIARKNDLTAYEAKAVTEAFKVFYQMGRFEAAEQTLNKATELFESIDSNSGRALVENLMGNLHYRQGYISRARAHYLSSLKQNPRPGLTIQMARVHANLGTMNWLLKDYTEALLHFGTCLKFFHAKRYFTEQSIVLQNICMLLQNLGLVDLALDLAEINRDLEIDYNYSVVHWNLLRLLGILWTDKREFKRAKQYLDQARTGIESASDQLSVAALHMEYGNYHRAAGKTQKAIRFYNLAVNTYESYGNTIEGTLLNNKLAEVYMDDGSFDMASSHLMRALRLAEDPEDELESYRLLVKLYNLMDKCAARDFYEQRRAKLESQIPMKPPKEMLDQLVEKGEALIEDLKRAR